MSDYVFDISAFRVAYPEFSAELYPDAWLNQNWTTAGCIISTCNYGYLAGDCRYQALTLLVAHLLRLGALIALGQTPSIVNSASIDMVSVSLTPPPETSQFAWWLNTTPYGAQLLVMLQVAGAGGLYVTNYCNFTGRMIR